MELVAERYKKTELGLIPSDWEVKELGSILTFGSGRDYKHLQNGEIPVYGTGGIMTYVDDFLYNGESVGIGRKGTIDKPVLLNGKFWTVDTLFYTYQFQNSNPKFIYYKFCLIKWKEYNEASGVPSLNKNTLEKIKISVPTFTEQNQIAQVLSDFDNLIDGLERLVAKKRSIKEGVMQELLRPKEGWTIRNIGSFTDVCSGGTPSTFISDYWNGNIRWMNSGELNFKRVYEVENRITELGLNNSATRLIPVNCVLIGLAGQGKTRGTVAINKVALCTNQSIAAIFPCEEVNHTFLYYNLDSRYHELRGLSTGDGGRGGLNLTIIKKLKISLPPPEEQKAIAQVLSDFDSLIDGLQLQINKQKQIKEGVMSQLLTGKTRLL
jgi:type I restriction enzyme S subunit